MATFTEKPRPGGRLLRTRCDGCGTSQDGTPKTLGRWKRGHAATCDTQPRTRTA